MEPIWIPYGKMSGKYPGNVRETSGKCPGNIRNFFLEKKCPGNVRETPVIFCRKNVRETPGKHPGNVVGLFHMDSIWNPS